MGYTGREIKEKDRILRGDFRSSEPKLQSLTTTAKGKSPLEVAFFSEGNIYYLYNSGHMWLLEQFRRTEHI